MGAAMAEPTAPSSDTTPLRSLLDGNQKTTRTIYPQALGLPSKKRQRNEPSDSSTERPSDETGADRRFKLEYSGVQQLPPALAAKQPAPTKARRIKAHSKPEQAVIRRNSAQKLLEGPSGPGPGAPPINNERPGVKDNNYQLSQPTSLTRAGASTPHGARPEWHPPWKLMRVISGHLGWVRSLAVEPGNKWFASGAGDRTIKIWDLATGSLRLTLTGHISTVRGLAVSPRHPYLFSCGEDKMVKCWDLETNKVIRHYHGHLSGVYTLALHPTLDVLVTGGRDGVARVWDMRTRSNIHVLSGHTGTVSDVKCQEADPQVMTGSLDATVRLWDLAAGKTMGVLTHHKKGVRALATHPSEFTFASGSTGSIKQWKCPEGAFMQNFDGHNAIINTLSVNQENVLFSGGDNGSMSFWDWKTGHRFQALDTTAQPGSLDAEAGIMSSTFDRSGLRLICGEADKTIKIWKQDEKATPESHPIVWQPTLARRKF
ncbi:WD domain-containing protein [Colletotrichum costaricense]|uniref:Pre-mRNA-splicing factor PRP46 n=1 Tax=Colletotrichum costaricense TaxID=1209916 RepID=A0AAJ0DRB6_9PEZI|nr:WD domain-containing protein [Colletotrichum costaricense]KAK1503201.1 WD domain-containing protein [Colletotrichum costaricense]